MCRKYKIRGAYQIGISSIGRNVRHKILLIYAVDNSLTKWSISLYRYRNRFITENLKFILCTCNNAVLVDKLG